MKARHSLAFLLVTGVAALALFGCNSQKRATVTKLVGSTMGTTFQATVIDAPVHLDKATLLEQVRPELDDLENSLSTYKKDSQLSLFNRAEAGQWISVDHQLAQVVHEAKEIAKKTEGRFDVTIGPVVNLWSFGPEKADQLAPPTDEQIRDALSQTGIDKVDVRFKPNLLKKTDPDLYIDLSGIAKGYAVDRLDARLEEIGLTDYYIEIGGEVRTRGLNQDGQRWRVGIESPDPSRPAPVKIVHISGEAVATSGSYRNFFLSDGQQYSHIIDPRTGRPTESTIVSATVIGSNCTEADALATAMMIATPEQALAMAVENKVAAFLLVQAKDGTLSERSTAGFKKYLAAKTSNLLPTILATIVIFALAMLMLYWVVRRRGGQHECSCKKAASIMKEVSRCESCTCPEEEGQR